MNSKLFITALSIALILPAIGEPLPVVPAEKGSLDTAGKFTPRPGAQPGKPAPPDSPIKVLGEGKLKIGDVLMDSAARTVTIPAKVNMPAGVVEYVLVMESGKAHESIFTTKATAEHIHIACLLLGMKAARQDPSEAVPDAQAVKVEVVWETNGPEKRIPLSDCIALAEGSPGKATGKTPPVGPWFYVGSLMNAGGFAATREGSIISAISDSTALVNNPHPDRADDKIHTANTPALPRKDLPVRIILTLPLAEKPDAAVRETIIPKPEK